MRQSPSINLVGKTESLLDRFVNWALNVGRAVIIVTEIIALTAFLYRFSLDRQLIDLTSKIRNEQAVLNLLKENEEIYRNLQNRLFLASAFGKQGKDRVQLAKDVIDFAPEGLTFNNINITEDRVRISADVSSVSSLSSFVSAIRGYKNIEKVSIDKIENRPSSAVITVSITAQLKVDKAYANLK
jgi:reverse gyrase